MCCVVLCLCAMKSGHLSLFTSLLSASTDTSLDSQPCAQSCSLIRACMRCSVQEKHKKSAAADRLARLKAHGVQWEPATSEEPGVEGLLRLRDGTVYVHAEQVACILCAMWQQGSCTEKVMWTRTQRLYANLPHVAVHLFFAARSFSQYINHTAGMAGGVSWTNFRGYHHATPGFPGMTHLDLSHVGLQTLVATRLCGTLIFLENLATIDVRDNRFCAAGRF